VRRIAMRPAAHEPRIPCALTKTGHLELHDDTVANPCVKRTADAANASMCGVEMARFT